MEPLIFSYEIGVVAGIFLVLAYGLMNFGVLTTDSPIYQSLNVLGALGFGYTAVSPFNPGLLLTEIVWGIVAVGFLWRIFSRRKKASNDVANQSVDTSQESSTGQDTDTTQDTTAPVSP